MLWTAGSESHQTTGGTASQAHPLGSETQDPVNEPRVGAARRLSALDLIARYANDPSFNPARAAQLLGMSVRYLHQLLKPSGRTFREHLIAQRLGRAFDMLHDKTFEHLKIDALARAAGFSDISHFNRRFRHAYGDTPYGVRVRSARATTASTVVGESVVRSL
jgi:AraC-like DNA-binding protein